MADFAPGLLLVAGVAAVTTIAWHAKPWVRNLAVGGRLKLRQLREQFIAFRHKRGVLREQERMRLAQLVVMPDAGSDSGHGNQPTNQVPHGIAPKEPRQTYH
jgi:hypothetical protein